MSARTNIWRLTILALLLSRTPRSVRQVIAWALFGALLAVAVIAFATIAHSDERLPKELLGSWCGYYAGDAVHDRPTKDDPCEEQDRFDIGGKMVTVEEFEYRIVKIKPQRRREGLSVWMVTVKDRFERHRIRLEYDFRRDRLWVYSKPRS